MPYNKKDRLSRYFTLFLLFFEIDIFLWILFELGYSFRPLIYQAGKVIIVLFFLEVLTKFIVEPYPLTYIKKNWFQWIAFFLLIYTYTKFRAIPPGDKFIFIYSRFYLGFIEILIFTNFIMRAPDIRSTFSSFRVNPAQLIIVSFASIILIGSFMLYLPYSTVGNKGIRYIDALFTSTSAVCVTGLVVVDTGTKFSIIGQIFILLLIQAGGLGIMTIAAFIQVSLGSQMSLYGRFSTAALLDQSNLKNLYTIIKSIVAITFVVESLGILMFYPYFYNLFHISGKAIYYSIFHSVSAFCNAGFSLFNTSFMNAIGNIWVNFVLMFLIVTGGLGFTVLLNLSKRVIYGEKERITVQTRLVLISTSFFIVIGAILFFLFERNYILKNHSPVEKFLASLFQSITTRTAGFNTVNTSNLRPITLFVMSIFMFIGASPGSTGGGIKTTTVFILFLSIITILRDQRFNTIFKRRIPYQVVNRAFAILVSAIVLVITAIILLGLTQSAHFISLYFEAISAFGTVGLSAGVTPNLTDFGKIIIIITMFAGRIGPLTLVLAIRNVQTTRLVTYPEERVMVG